MLRGKFYLHVICLKISWTLLWRRQSDQLVVSARPRYFCYSTQAVASHSEGSIGYNWVWDKKERTWWLGKQWDNMSKCTQGLILHTPARARKHTRTHTQGREEQDSLLSQNIISGIKDIWAFRGGGNHCSGTKNHTYGKNHKREQKQENAATDKVSIQSLSYLPRFSCRQFLLYISPLPSLCL